MNCISYCKRFKKKYPSTVAWRVKENARIVDMHVNPDEEVSYAFVGQKNDSFVDFFETAAIAITNERILIGQKRVLFGYSLSSITPDLYNDMKVYEGVFWGKIIIDTVKEVIVISNLSKDSLVEIETEISSFMMKAKAKDNEE
jgi:hypothetical protein